MRPKFYLSMILLFFGIGITNAQNNNYYYYKGEKIPLRLDRQSLTVSVFKGFAKNSLRGLNIKKINAQNSEGIEYSTIEYQMKPTDKEYNQNLKKLKNNGSVRTVSPNFIGKNGEKIGMSDYFYVKLKKPSDFEKLKQLTKENHVRIIEQNRFMPLWYTLRCTKRTKRNTLEVANSFFETGLFSSSSPDFLENHTLLYPKSNADLHLRQLRQTNTDNDPEGPAPCSNDPDFDKLWGLRNDANPSIDINACEAWEITEGEGVKVAIIDTGIALDHPDLIDNISSLSYDTDTDSSPSQIRGDVDPRDSFSLLIRNQGTHIAGIIGAVKDNNIAVVGVAPQSTLMSISNSFLGRNPETTDTPKSRMDRANGINWAWKHGADVINNSWFSLAQFDAIDDAITNALTQGRDGKGTVLVFSAGVQYSREEGSDFSVAYPANLNPDIIAVGGGINKYGFKSPLGRYGDKLDVVAPGIGITSTYYLYNDQLTSEGRILTTGNELSAAFVSGVAALVLSVNPCLTVHQVNDIIEQTAQKINPIGEDGMDRYSYTTHESKPNGTWDNEIGYGLVDAYAAVQLAKKSKLELWLKANEGGALWSDQSRNGVRVTPEGTIAMGSELNFNPTNSFGSSAYYDTNLDISGRDKPFLSVTSVYIPTSNPSGGLWGEGDGQNTDGRADRVMLDWNGGAGRWNNTIGAGGEFLFDVDHLFVQDAPTITTVIFDEDVPDGSSAYVNGKKEKMFTSNHAPGTSNPFEIGRVGKGSSTFNGRIAEVMVHSRSFNRNQVESYLAFKYGITLDQTEGQSYVNSECECTEIYDADGTFDDFDHDIIGIGQDDGTSLDQRISKSVNSGSILILSNDADFTSSNTNENRTSLGNGYFLMTGHNGGDLVFSEDFNDLPHSLMSRVWAFDETGTVGNVHIAIRQSDLVFNGKLYAVLSDDQTFDHSDRFVEMTSDGTFWFGAVNPNDGDYLSFVSIIEPGGISNNIVAWLKSETGTNTTIEGNDVTSWRNSILNPVYNLRSFNTLEFTVEGVSSALNSAPPTYESDVDNLLNFHPSILFENDVSGLGERLFTRGVDNLSDILNAQPIKGSTLYAIGMPRGYFNDFWAGFDSDDLMISDKSPLGMIGDNIYFHISRLINGKFETESIPTNTTWENGEIALLKVTIPNATTTSVTYNKNGGADDVINDVYVGGGYYHIFGNIGNTAAPEGVDNHFGNIAETIIYGTASLSDVESSRIESYLALKYGITLDQAKPQSYVNSHGVEIYDADGAFNDFDHNIIGIGKDIESSLDQRVSKSVHEGAVLTLATTKDFTGANNNEDRISLEDESFLITGNNGESVVFGRSFEGEENAMINRIWAFEETGTVGDVYVALPISGFNIHGNNLYAVLSEDQTFESSDIFLKMIRKKGFWFAKINPNNGNFMTFVSTDADLKLYDLYIKDSPDDIGEEPNTITGEKIWRSPDIWIRNKADGIEGHQNPIYDPNNPNNPNYVYVRVRNRSNVASTGDDHVKLYWKKAGTVSGWPQGWDGSVNFDNGALGSGLVGTVTIPVIEPGEEAVLSFPWNTPNPLDYSEITPDPWWQKWHFCFLARIISERDPMTNEQEDRYTSTNARKNNNIAWNNVMVVKTSSKKRKSVEEFDIRSFGGTISVGNPFDEAKAFSIELIKEESEIGKAIFDAAEVSLEMDKTLV